MPETSDAVVTFALSLSLLAAPADADAAAEQLFERRIRPILVERCYGCHSANAEHVRGGLLLDSREGLRRGGEHGPAIVPGDAGKSLLLRAIRREGPKMPPDAPLRAEVVDDFAVWVSRGAPDPRVAVAEPARSREGAVNGRGLGPSWAFAPPRAHEPPAVRLTNWPRTRIDRFILAGLEEAGVPPAPPASPSEILRRLAFDLTGLPPQEASPRPDTDVGEDAAYAAQVERLLAAPQFGERWARPWLDLARYAEDQAHIVGDDRSLCFPNAFLYRDWLIRALNEDLPYTRFVELQLAADLIEGSESSNLPALGFLGLGPKYYNRGNAAVMADEWEDRVDVVCRGLLGLTVACARCHDHKFDPIPTQDYYALAGVFASTEMWNRPLEPGQRAKKDGQAESPADALHIVRDGEPRDLHVFLRGNIENQGPAAPRRFLTALGGRDSARFGSGSGRLELARSITSPTNPLMARVLVNRVWGECFGRPLVSTPSNFGALGERPSHPDLLDDLAVRFVENGASLKWLLREIVMSSTYRQSSREVAVAADPDNRFFGRANRRRRTVEAWRDAVLAAAGTLDLAIGGPSIDPLDPACRRRTVYSAVSRLQLNRLLALFDFPDPNVHAERRLETTTPLQKLFLLNGDFLREAAKRLARRLEVEASSAPARIERAYRLLFSRQATDTEVRLGLEFLQGEGGDERSEVLEDYTHALLCSDEMLYVD